MAMKLKELQDKHLCYKLVRDNMTIAELVVYLSIGNHTTSAV